MPSVTFSVLLGLHYLVAAQDRSISGPTTSASAARYSCDPNKCKLPKCNCARTSPPGGLSPSEDSQFVLLTADDAIHQFLAHRKNPNGCPLKMTYVTSLTYTNYTLVTDWYVVGNEIADHMSAHVGNLPAAEINGNIIALNELAGIPIHTIKGLRAPSLNYTSETFHFLAVADVMYDSSTAASIPVTDPDTDAHWPYTLDCGLVDNCLTVQGICQGQPQLPGIWEMPMYAFFDERGLNGPHLINASLDPENGAPTVNDIATLEYMMNVVISHYNGNRQPIGLYMHPIHLSLTYPGVDVPTSTINTINQSNKTYGIVSDEQLLAWVQNPVPIFQLNTFDRFKCPIPDINPTMHICNGIPANEQGLLNECAFPDFPFYIYPSPANPNPPQQVPESQQARFRREPLSICCFWDPVAGVCPCTSDECAFVDRARPIESSGANLTGGSTGGSHTNSSAVPVPTPSMDVNARSGRRLSCAKFAAAVVFGVVFVFVL
ncbi:hypothetical protein L210DRAFT_3613529 [Boletus edulis BED1]|uniref:Chitin deacetylase n=1 Tax=Boletus edulis BED1 TaxID=1328754 RepID=A0AAD4BP26_BOLED|nr:hypothetical protein L210DRAFT_3613529 [Boletus edulis BED1]